jgi:hypothetical protein
VARQAAQKKTEDAYATWTQECAAALTLSTATSPMKHVPKALRPAFLSDPAIIDGHRARHCAAGASPWSRSGRLAALTQPLVERLGRLTVIELDRDLARACASRSCGIEPMC